MKSTKPLIYSTQFDTRTTLRGARFVGSKGAVMDFRCYTGANIGNYVVFKPSTGSAAMFTPYELRGLSCFLSDLADRIEQGEEVEF